MKERKLSMHGTYKVGDRVRLLGYKKAYSWGGLKPEKFGYIVHIDGGYIYVHPRWKPRKKIFEVYASEIAHAPLARR